MPRKPPVLVGSRAFSSVSYTHLYYGETRTVDVHIRYLRKKIEDDQEKYIETVRGVGYRLVENLESGQ